MSNTALVYRPREIWNTGDIELIDGVYAENFVAHWPASSEVSERIDGFRFGVVTTLARRRLTPTIPAEERREEAFAHGVVVRVADRSH